MSSNSGGVNFATRSSQWIRDASDVTRQKKQQLTYLNFTADNGAPRYKPDNVSNESYLTFLFGRKEGCASCTGLPFQKNLQRSFR